VSSPLPKRGWARPARASSVRGSVQDVMGVPTVLVARTDAHSAQLLLTDADPRDEAFIASRERTPEGFFRLKGGIDCAIARAVAYAPYADLLWCETSTPDLEDARCFAEGVHAKYPGKLLMYNCSPSFNWKKNLDDATIARFQRELGAMGYKFQFVTLAGFHALNHGMFELAREYRDRGMTAYTELQQAEFAAEARGANRKFNPRFESDMKFNPRFESERGGSPRPTQAGDKPPPYPGGGRAPALQGVSGSRCARQGLAREEGRTDADLKLESGAQRV